MKRTTYNIALLAALFASSSVFFGDKVTAQPSQSVVYVDGQRYVVHIVKQGETLYSLSRMYGVSVEDIFKSNPIIRNGLNAGINIKIPHITKAVETESDLGEEAREGFNTHIIVRSETLYSISRHYNVPVETIMEDNPSLDPTQISVGQVINIRKEGVRAMSKEEKAENLATYNELIADAPPQGMKYYTVKPNDRLQLLAKQYQITPEKIAIDNDLSSIDDNALIVGSRILLPNSEPISLMAYENMEYERDFIFSPLSKGSTLDIALLLPLESKGRVMRPMAEFYKGFLLGIEDLKIQGHNVNVTLFDTKRNVVELQNIINSEAYLEADLIIGPVFEELLPDVLSDAEQRAVPVVSPLATLEKVDSPVLFQLAPVEQNRMLGIRDKITADKTVTLIYSDDNDAKYVKHVKQMLENQGVAHQTQYYAYVHPSKVSELKANAKQELEIAERDAALEDIELDPWLVDSLKYRFSNSELMHLVANGAQHNTFFIMSDNETDVDRILSTIASTRASQIARNRGRKARITDKRLELRAPSPYNVIANPKWEDYKNIDHTVYFKTGVIDFQNYYAGREAEVIRDFDARYVREFSELPSLYTYRGYDVAVIFGQGMFSDIEYNMEGRDFTPLANTYRFSKVMRDSTGYTRGRYNSHWTRVEYKTNYTIDVK